MLTCHVKGGKMKDADLSDSQELATLEESTLQVPFNCGSITFGCTNVAALDNSTTNGIIHVIDKEVLPQE